MAFDIDPEYLASAGADDLLEYFGDCRRDPPRTVPDFEDAIEFIVGARKRLDQATKQNEWTPSQRQEVRSELGYLAADVMERLGKTSGYYGFMKFARQSAKKERVTLARFLLDAMATRQRDCLDAF